MTTMSKTEKLTVVATGRVAPYGIGEIVGTINCNVRAINKATAAGHIVRDNEGSRVSTYWREIVRWDIQGR